MGDYKNSAVYQRAYELALDIFSVSKNIPPLEAPGLKEKLQDASRSVCLHLADGFKRKRSRDYFDAKFYDAEMANEEVGILLDFLNSYEYINRHEYAELVNKNTEIGEMIRYMLEHPNKF
ncbi:MAG: four helix bundle protein [Bacteroidetes bacterium]|nr:four helix bundle protein [Bacteroidota bacterium]MBS1933112.1 four helix bundle protein [Bacteroidota bacterium]